MNSNKDFILITGVAGFIGMHLANKFLKNGYNVLGIDNENSYYDITLKHSRILNIVAPKNIEFIYLKNDINDKMTWKKVDNFKIISVFHLAAQAGVRYSILNPWAYINANISGFQNVLDYVSKKKINNFFYASSSSVYGKSTKTPFNEKFNCNKPESYYAATKIANEMMAYSYEKTHDLKSIGLRFFTVYGPWGRPDMAPYIFVKSAFDRSKVKVFNNGNQKRDFTYIDDIINSIFLLHKNINSIKKSSLINIGFGSPSSLEEFISIIENETNNVLNKEYVDAQKGDVKITYADTNKIRKLINYKPKTDLKKGIKLFVNWYKKFNMIKN